MAGDTTWVGKKPTRRLGGMADALALASDLGFSIPTSQEEDQSSPGASKINDKSDDLVKVLRELTSVQRNLANLQVELQGRKDDKNLAHLTHVSEMEKKCESLSRMTAILKDVIQNKDRIIARLQQPYSLDCIPVEAEFQKQFSELLLKAASDYGALTAAVGDLQWSQNFRESPTVWGEMLRPIPVALASCTRFFEAMSAMRDSFATLQKLRVGQSCVATPAKSSEGTVDSNCVTPPLQWNSTDFSAEEPNSDDVVIRSRQKQDGIVEEDTGEENKMEDPHNVDPSKQRRLSWPCSPKPGV
ncbi:AUGMIN subunit 2 [Nymphaea thermarum]|nr:AUGMIN subunit 2 [Nymphaea thermarum]